MMGGALRACHCLTALCGPLPPTTTLRMARRGLVQKACSGRAPRKSQQFAPKTARISGGH
eukprot:349720-Lingulodinium_polyedra.AAC.1